MDKTYVARDLFGGDLVCDPSAIPPDDRLRYRDLRLQLRSAHISFKAINEGYVVQLNQERMSMADVSAWIGFESLCCPWLSLSVERVEQTTLEVLMKAPDHAKHVLRMELQEFLPNDLLK